MNLHYSIQVYEEEDRDLDDILDDGDWNGGIGPGETYPLDTDTNNDQFWDGFDVKNSNGDWKRGEMYIKGASIQGYDYKREYYVEQFSSTDPLNSDSDGDNIEDGMEFHAWGNYKYMKIRVPTSKGIVMADFYDVQSDPSTNDTDMDDLKDREEYDAGTLPNASDSDRDGIEDVIEDGSGTNPTDCDTDQDGIPDGWVDGWWFDTGDREWYLDDSRKNTTREYWEGEDRNCDGSQEEELNETDPLSPDSDDDGIEDPDEYFFYLQDLSVYSLASWTDPETDANIDGKGRINPLDSDSDEDGLLDGEEDYDHDGELDAVVGTDTDNPYYSSAWEPNPYCSDSDMDGLLDGEDCQDPDSGVIWRSSCDMDSLINAMDNNSDDDQYKDGDIEEEYPLTPYNANLTDSDNDGIINIFEDTTEPYGVYNEGDASNYFDPDTDGDGLTDLQELQNGTNRKEPDTDNDGLTDYEELVTLSSYGIDPRVNDTDNDGIDDWTEISWGTNPKSKDSDDDFLQDNFEKEKDLDSDGDGIINALESDSDNDGLQDWDEEFKYNTDSTNKDTDGEGLTDYYELMIFGSNPLLTNTDGNAHLQTRAEPDTGGDGLDDKKELHVGTDPYNPDTDGDDVNDDIDIEPKQNNFNITFEVTEINALDENIDDFSPPDFKICVHFYEKRYNPRSCEHDAEWHQIGKVDEERYCNDKYNIFNESKFFISEDIDKYTRWIKIEIELKDMDVYDRDMCDINPRNNFGNVLIKDSL